MSPSSSPTLSHVVRASVANLRREPSHASELVSQLILGEPADVLEERRGWVRVAGTDGYAGWTEATSVVEPEAVSYVGAALVWTRPDGRVREAADPGAAPVRDLVLGARVNAREGRHDLLEPTPDGARRVRLPDGLTAWADAAGWIEESELEVRFPPLPGALVATALGLRGVPYLWGGTSSKAFDCSGFVQRVHTVHGVRLPRDAWQQAEVGTELRADRTGLGLRPSDLVFFSEDAGRVTHVGIALGERGRFVHASTRRGGVGVDSLDPDDELYNAALAETLIGCRGVLSSGSAVSPPPTTAWR